jgi:BirA family biotin operon repressor/biotin-[acetyl-CoA-carboxylase] ligase
VLPGSRLFTAVRVVGCTGSTNADLLAASRTGAVEGTVLAAEEQTAGRGRLDRSWQNVPGASLAVSVLLRPTAVPTTLLGWLPLLVGVAVTSALRAETGLDVGLKWPNDVLCGGGKLAGILAEQGEDAIVAGVGLNVTTTRDELPGPAATSLALQGAHDADRQAVLVAMLRELETWYLRWTGAAEPGDPAGSGLRAEYLRLCVTIGRDVQVRLPGGATLTGSASDVDELGRLVVGTPSGPEPISAGDVVHVR